MQEVSTSSLQIFLHEWQRKLKETASRDFKFGFQAPSLVREMGGYLGKMGDKVRKIRVKVRQLSG
jgi:hypothetical protein